MKNNLTALVALLLIPLLAIGIGGEYKYDRLKEKLDTLLVLVEEQEREIVSRDTAILETLLLLVEEQERGRALQDLVVEVLEVVVEKAMEEVLGGTSR